MGEDELAALFLLAGIRLYGKEPIKNGYDRTSALINGPWWQCHTSIGPITMGWRKRVVEISWFAFVTPDDEPVTKDDVTKGNNFVHAYSYPKAIEYLSTLRRAFDRAARQNKLLPEFAHD